MNDDLHVDTSCYDSKITEFEMIDTKKILYCLCDDVWIDYIMVFGLDKEGGNFDYSHGVGASSPSH